MKGNPIYGLACPRSKHLNRNLSSKEKKCGCQMKPKKTSINHQANLVDYSSQIFNSNTNAPFDTQVHIVNLNNGQGTVTQSNGQFVIQALPTDLLQITHVGFGQITVKASELTDKITLAEATEHLNEVVIKPECKKKAVLVALGLAAVLAIVYASSDEDNKVN